MSKLDLDAIRLQAGAHEESSGEMCIMEAVAYVAGEPWSDSPQCASPAIAAFLRFYNDAVDDEDRQSLKQYIPRLIGTRGSAALEEKRAVISVDWLNAAAGGSSWEAWAALNPAVRRLQSTVPALIEAMIETKDN